MRWDRFAFFKTAAYLLHVAQAADDGPVDFTWPEVRTGVRGGVAPFGRIEADWVRVPHENAARAPRVVLQCLAECPLGVALFPTDHDRIDFHAGALGDLREPLQVHGLARGMKCPREDANLVDQAVLHPSLDVDAVAAVVVARVDDAGR